jgi:hypothetical protein
MAINVVYCFGDAAGAVTRAEPLRDDAFKAKLAGVAHGLSVSVSYRGALLFPSK